MINTVKIVDNFFLATLFNRNAQKIKYLNTKKIEETWYHNSMRVGDDAEKQCNS